MSSAELQDRYGHALTTKQKRAVGTAMAQTLNGLERLAAGIDGGVYDLTTVRALGATIIVRTYERFERYIRLRRDAPDADRRQRQVWVNLSALVMELRRHGLDTERLEELRRR